MANMDQKSRIILEGRINMETKAIEIFFPPGLPKEELEKWFKEVV